MRISMAHLVAGRGSAQPRLGRAPRRRPLPCALVYLAVLSSPLGRQQRGQGVWAIPRERGSLHAAAAKLGSCVTPPGPCLATPAASCLGTGRVSPAVSQAVALRAEGEAKGRSGTESAEVRLAAPLRGRGTQAGADGDSYVVAPLPAVHKKTMRS